MEVRSTTCTKSHEPQKNRTEPQLWQNERTGTAARPNEGSKPCTKSQAPVVQKVDSAIHRINLYPVDSANGFPNTYPLDSDYPVDSAIQRLNNRGLEPKNLRISEGVLGEDFLP